jgi:hypothetical protein
MSAILVLPNTRAFEINFGGLVIPHFDSNAFQISVQIKIVPILYFYGLQTSCRGFI